MYWTEKLGSDHGCEVMANVLDGFGDEEGLKCFLCSVLTDYQWTFPGRALEWGLWAAIESWSRAIGMYRTWAMHQIRKSAKFWARALLMRPAIESLSPCKITKRPWGHIEARWGTKKKASWVSWRPQTCDLVRAIGGMRDCHMAHSYVPQGPREAFTGLSGALRLPHMPASHVFR